MAKLSKTALKNSLIPALMTLVIIGSGCSNIPTPASDASPRSISHPRLNYEDGLTTLLTQPEARQVALDFAATKRDSQTYQRGHSSTIDYSNDTSTQELTKSWHTLDMGLYDVLTGTRKSSSNAISLKENKTVASFIQMNQNTLIATNFTTNFYGAATKQKFARRQQLIKHSVLALRRLPQTVKNATSLLEIEQQLASLDQLYKIIDSNAQSLNLSMKGAKNRTNKLKAHFYTQIPAPHDVIMKHPHIINIMMNSLENTLTHNTGSNIESENYEHLWDLYFPSYAYRIPINAAEESPALETWNESSKILIKELKSAAINIHTETQSTPRGVNYTKESKNHKIKREQLFEIAMMARLRIAILDYANRYDEIKTLMQQVNLQKTLTPRLNVSILQDHENVLNNIRLCSLEIQTHIAYGELMSSLIRANASVNANNPLASDVESVFITANTPNTGKKLGNITHQKKNQTSSTQTGEPSHHVETLSTLRPNRKLDQQIFENNDQYGIRLLYARSHAEFAAHRSYSGLRDLPYRTQLKGYDTHYSIYYATYPSQQAARQGLKQIPQFYQLFKPEIKRLPN